MIRFGVIGAGWRAEFYFRIAAALPETCMLTGVYIRRPEVARRMEETYRVKICHSLDELLQTGCDFVVSCVSSGHIADTVAELSDRGVPVLTETPAGADPAQIARLRQQMQPSWRVQVAEQFHLQPRYRAVQAVIDSGLIGPVHHVQLSVCHGYHAVSLIRHFLGTGMQLPQVTAVTLPEYGTRYNGRQGLTDPQPVQNGQTVSVLTFGDKSALYDFTREQYFSAIRSQRMVIRGSSGEIVNDRCTYLDNETPMPFTLTRDMCGENGNLDGLYLRAITGGGRVLYRNPFPGARLTDEETAIAACLTGMDTYLHGGAPFYPLEEGLLDAEIACLINDAAR